MTIAVGVSDYIGVPLPVCPTATPPRWPQPSPAHRKPVKPAPVNLHLLDAGFAGLPRYLWRVLPTRLFLYVTLPFGDLTFRHRARETHWPI